MSLLPGMEASASGLTAQRFRLDVIADNIANVSTTRTSEGGPYRRHFALFQAREASAGPIVPDLFREALDQPGRGVRVVAVDVDRGPLRMVYDPDHPDADADGYVSYPNVDIAREMVDMISATRAYEANATAISSAKDMASRALQIGT
jgi:flagellar basal-body rod protein FlgC